jgi:acetoin utilization protein AcuC
MHEPTIFIGNEIFRHSRYGGKHPLAIPRVSLATDLCRELGWLPDGVYVESPVASVEQLTRFHDPEYVQAVLRCEGEQSANEDDKERFNLGINGNPVFGEIFRRPATACGATLHAVDYLRDGGVVYSPAGGTHHGRRAQASGFCYFNDLVLGILAFLDQGLERIAYLDLDAHHGDGVEFAFEDDPSVMTISIHEGKRWPFTGIESDPKRNIFNFPMPRGANDSELAQVILHAAVPLLEDFKPQALIVQGGCDGLKDDPMSRLEFSNNALVQAVRSVKHLAPRLLVTGGGGYNPWTVARCWSRVWAELAGHEVEETLPSSAQNLLRSVTWSHSKGRNPPDEWFTTLSDIPNDGALRPEVLQAVAQAIPSGMS